MQFSSDLIRVAHALLGAKSLLILTGAGISAESGLPTFRQAQSGFWARFSPHELATPEGFRADPVRVWGWYTWRRHQLQRAKPNPGHQTIVELMQRFPSTTLVTQNVDDLHERAGSADVIHLHGELNRNRCLRCGKVFHFSDAYQRAIDALDLSQAEQGHFEALPPDCPHCGGVQRPDVVWFGEPLPLQAWAAAEQAARCADVVLCVGTSGLVYPAASLPEIAATQGAFCVQINPESTALDAVFDVWLQGAAGTVLPALLRAID